MTITEMEKSAQSLPRLLNLKEVIQATGIGRSTIYKKIEEGTFPKGRKISDACVRWVDTDIRKWIDDLPTH